jgi:hypothetical protein
MINRKQEIGQNYETSDAIFLLRAKYKTGSISLRNRGLKIYKGQWGFNWLGFFSL